MIYAYQCAECGEKVDIVKAVKDYDRVEYCKDCNTVLTRCFSATRLYFNNTAVQEREFCPAIGHDVTKRERQQIAKERGWVEIGNERPEKHLKPQLSEYPTFTNEEIRQLTTK